MATLDVVEVESKDQLKQFIRFPTTLYKGISQYVVPLVSERNEFFDTKKNPFYRSARTRLFLAVKDGEVCGRVATCVNYRHNDYHAEKTGFFGFFDSIDDFDVAQRLLKVAMITLKKEGMERMRGPMNFSTNHEIGFLIDGFDLPPTVMMPWNYPYQPKLAEKFGLKKVMDLNAYRLDKTAGISDRVARVTEALQKRGGIKIRTLRMRDFDNEVRKVLEIYNAAWAPNWGFVPMDEEEFFAMAKQLKQIVDPDMVFIAEHDGEPVAFSLALPDINQALIHLHGRLLPVGIFKLLWHTKVRNKINGVRMLTMGVVPKFQKRAIDLMLYTNTFRQGSEKGYHWAELSWILETNELMNRAAADMGARLYKKYRIMEMPL